MKRLWILAILALLFSISQGTWAIRPAAVGDIVHKGGGVYDVRGYGATGDGVTDDYTAINNAATAAAGETLEFKAGTYIIGTNLAIDEDAFFYKGAVIKPSNGIAITLTGALTAGPYQIFDESAGGTVTISNGMSNEVLPQWWNGAVIQAFTDADATPSIRKGRMFATANTGATTITMFDDGISGQVIRIFLGDGNTTFDFTASNLKGNGGSDWTAAAGDSLIAAFDGTDWYCGIDTAAAGGAALWRQEATDNFFGPSTAGTSLTTGDYNTMGGEDCGTDILEGSYNTGFGFETLKELAYGVSNTAFGYRAMHGDGHWGGIGGTGNVAVGFKANDQAYGGDYNVSVGYEAGYDVDSADYGVHIGYQTGYTDVSLHRRISIGTQAMYTGGGNHREIAIGDLAMYTLSASAGVGGVGNAGPNVAIGGSALYGMTTGDLNIFIGFLAGQSAVKGIGNIGMGYLALDTLGFSTAADAGNNYRNIGIGHQAGTAIDGGSGNLLIGSTAGRNITTGDSNIQIGSRGLSITTGVNNIAIGADAGFYANTTSSRNIYLGSQGAGISTTENDQLYIGNGTDPVLVRGDFSASTFTLNSSLILAPAATQAITGVGDAITASTSTVVLNPDGDYTLTSTPTIADGTTGQVIRLVTDNAEANTVTVQDQDTLANSNLQLNDTTRAIGAKVVLELVFDGTDWVEIDAGQGAGVTSEKDLVSGAGLTGGEDDVLIGADSDLTLAVGAGDGVIVNADEIEVYGLVASDGDPNDAVVIDANGLVDVNYKATFAGEIDWAAGNVTYVPLTGDIQTYVTAATAGDTLVLASGVYTITSTITSARAGLGSSLRLSQPVTAR
jgi:hypothetical protein